MISPGPELHSATVAGHYDELDHFYREVWGEHVHHGLWRSGSESREEATRELVRCVARRGRIGPGSRVCDIGCGYGATARMLAAEYGAEVTGVTVSAAQFRHAAAMGGRHVSYVLGDWLQNPLEGGGFDVAIAIESSEHMPDIREFFHQAARVLRPGGRLVICAWLAHPGASRVQRAALLEPICREGRMAQMGSFADYHRWYDEAGFAMEGTEDVSREVRRTWPCCAGRFLAKLAREPRYVRFLVNRHRGNRVFALTIFRIWFAFKTGAMQYGIFTGVKV